MSYEDKISPVSQDFIWVADYIDGTHYSEFDFATKQENPFQGIDRKKLLRFGLLGNGVRLLFEVSGIFKLAGQMIEVVYKTENKEYYLTGQQIIYNDIISYKDAESSINLLGGGVSNTSITQYNFGYKANLNIDDVNFHFKAICKIPHDEQPYMNFWLVANKKLNGVLQIKKNGRVIEEVHAPLDSGIGGEINWLAR